MRAFRAKSEKFEPVTLMLDTQEEVDKLFAMANHNRFSVAMRIATWRSILAPYRSAHDGYSEYHNIICRFARGGF